MLVHAGDIVTANHNGVTPCTITIVCLRSPRAGFLVKEAVQVQSNQQINSSIVLRNMHVHT